MKVIVLLSTYNGEKYLREQLDSIIGQTIPVDILVRDDGSTDSTCEILQEYKNQGKLDWYKNENLRPAKSFWNLVATAPPADFYAFCDQDDYWFEDKIERAVNKLSQLEESRPLLYCSSVTVVDEKLNPINKSVTIKSKYTDFAHSLIYSLAPGCTFVFNRAAADEMIKYDMNENFEIIHDWLAHKIVSMLGTVVYDNQPSMFYRQHGNNVIGAQRGGVSGLVKKIKRFFNGSSTSVRSESAKSLLAVYGNQADSQAKELLETVAHYKGDKRLKRKFLKSKQFKSDFKSNLCLRWLIRLNKV